MKYLLLFIFLLICEKSFSQNSSKKIYVSESSIPRITAKDVYKYRGGLIFVLDSIYSGEIRDDSTAVCKVGPKTDTPRLTVFIIYPPIDRPLKPNFITPLQRGKVLLMGIPAGPKQFPVMLVHSDNIHELNVSPGSR